ncbi:hypothetical protein Tco_0283122 [Tanacetum coccineum]
MSVEKVAISPRSTGQKRQIMTTLPRVVPQEKMFFPFSSEDRNVTSRVRISLQILYLKILQSTQRPTKENNNDQAPKPHQEDEFKSILFVYTDTKKLEEGIDFKEFICSSLLTSLEAVIDFQWPTGSSLPEGFVVQIIQKSLLLRKALVWIKSSSKKPGDKLVSWMSKKQNCTAMSFSRGRVVRLGINPMIQPEPEDLPKDNPKLEIAVLRTFGVRLFSIHNDDGNPIQCHHQTAALLRIGQKQEDRQDGKDDKDNDKGSKSRSQSMKEQAYNIQQRQRPRTLELKRQKQSH